MQLAAFGFVEIDDLQGTPDRCECEDDHPCTEKGDEHEDFRDSCSRGNHMTFVDQAARVLESSSWGGSQASSRPGYTSYR